jgi:hypothetical protein
MTVTVRTDNFSVCHKGANGIAAATIPDVCKTPTPGGPVPMPYPNIAMSSSLSDGTKTVKADGNMCGHKPSKYSRSNGDEPGVAGGVKSSVNMSEATWITFSFTVKLEGEGACRLTDKMFNNKQNTASL